MSLSKCSSSMVYISVSTCKCDIVYVLISTILTVFNNITVQFLPDSCQPVFVPDVPDSIPDGASIPVAIQAAK